MSGQDLEHRTEIRRASRTAPRWIGVAVVAVAVALVVGSSRLRPDEEQATAPTATPTSTPSTPTSETLTTTAPRDQFPVYGLTATAHGLLPFSTAVAPRAGSPSGRGGTELAGGPIVTGDRVVVLDTSGALHAGAPGGPLREAGCCWDEMHPSNEPDHVWGRAGDHVTLIDLDAVGSSRRVTLDVGGAQVLGPASFGVVTLDDRNVVRWHRPSFEPAAVRLPLDRRAIDSGGERLLVWAPGTEGGPNRLETWSIAGNGMLTAHHVDEGSGGQGALSPDGSVVLVPAPHGWTVRDAATGLLHGALPAVSRPVWVGDDRFAAALDERLVVSGTGELPLRWPVLAVAEQSP